MPILARVLSILGCVVIWSLLNAAPGSDLSPAVGLGKTVVAAIFFILLIPILPFLVDWAENALGMEYPDTYHPITRAPAPSEFIRARCPGCGHIDYLEHIDSAWHCSNCKRAFVSWRPYRIK